MNSRVGLLNLELKKIKNGGRTKSRFYFCNFDCAFLAIFFSSKDKWRGAK